MHHSEFLSQKNDTLSNLFNREVQHYNLDKELRSNRINELDRSVNNELFITLEKRCQELGKELEKEKLKTADYKVQLTNSQENLDQRENVTAH